MNVPFMDLTKNTHRSDWKPFNGVANSKIHTWKIHCVSYDNTCHAYNYNNIFFLCPQDFPLIFSTVYYRYSHQILFVVVVVIVSVTDFYLKTRNEQAFAIYLQQISFAT